MHPRWGAYVVQRFPGGTVSSAFRSARMVHTFHIEAVKQLANAFSQCRFFVSAINRSSSVVELYGEGGFNRESPVPLRGAAWGEVSAPKPRGNTKAVVLPTVETQEVAGRGLM